MKTNKRHKAGLYIGLLSLYTLSACNSTRQEYGEILHSPQTVHHSRSFNVSEIYDTYNPPAFSVTDGSVHSTMDRPYEKCAIDAIKNGERPGFWGTGKPIWSRATIIPMEPSPSKNARSQPTITPWLLSSLSLGSIALYNYLSFK